MLLEQRQHFIVERNLRLYDTETLGLVILSGELRGEGPYEPVGGIHIKTFARSFAGSYMLAAR